MNALPSDLVRQTQELSDQVTRPIPGSRKIHVTGSRQDLRVPLREVVLSDTPLMFGAEKNAPVTVYDTSGPYTDPDYKIDLSAGLPALRARWIAERGDVEELPGLTSEFGRMRASDHKLDAVRFPNLHRPLRARGCANVTQMHYARKGVVTPEMEFVALRENQRIEALEAHLRRAACGRELRRGAAQSDHTRVRP